MAPTLDSLSASVREDAATDRGWSHEKSMVGLRAPLRTGGLRGGFQATLSAKRLSAGWLRATVMVATLPITMTVIKVCVGTFVVRSLVAMAQGGMLDASGDFVACIGILAVGLLSLLAGTIIHNSICTGAMHVGGGIVGAAAARFSIRTH